MLYDIEDELSFQNRNRLAATGKPIQRVIYEFQELIERNNHLYMLFSLMFDEAPRDGFYLRDSLGKTLRLNYEHLLILFNAMLTRAPLFGSDPAVFCPLNAVLGWSLATIAGSAAFTNVEVNQQMGRILRQWAHFLASPESKYGLHGRTSKGWFCPAAMAAMPDFDQTYICDPQAPCYGFNSWDDFYTRKLRPNARPIEAPDDEKVIISACESTHCRLRFCVQGIDEFWKHDQPYSLYHMLAHDNLAKGFVGGTVYQAFLSSTNYHRWHSPVDGMIVKTRVEPGSCIALTPSVTRDPQWLLYSPSFFAAMATRAIIFIMSSNNEIGLMCFMAIGTAETSCEITVHQGQQMRKGEELGMFHFGGFSYCMLFGPDTRLQWNNIRNEMSMEWTGPGFGKDLPGVLSITKVNERLATTLP